MLLYTGSDHYHVCVSSLKAVLDLTKLKQQHMMPWETLKYMYVVGHTVLYARQGRA